MTPNLSLRSCYHYFFFWSPSLVFWMWRHQLLVFTQLPCAPFFSPLELFNIFLNFRHGSKLVVNYKLEHNRKGKPFNPCQFDWICLSSTYIFQISFGVIVGHVKLLQESRWRKMMKALKRNEDEQSHECTCQMRVWIHQKKKVKNDC